MFKCQPLLQSLFLYCLMQGLEWPCLVLVKFSTHPFFILLFFLLCFEEKIKKERMKHDWQKAKKQKECHCYDENMLLGFFILLCYFPFSSAFFCLLLCVCGNSISNWFGGSDDESCFKAYIYKKNLFKYHFGPFNFQTFFYVGPWTFKVSILAHELLTLFYYGSLAFNTVVLVHKLSTLFYFSI